MACGPGARRRPPLSRGSRGGGELGVRALAPTRRRRTGRRQPSPAAALTPDRRVGGQGPPRARPGAIPPAPRGTATRASHSERATAPVWGCRAPRLAAAHRGRGVGKAAPGAARAGRPAAAPSQRRAAPVLAALAGAPGAAPGLRGSAPRPHPRGSARGRRHSTTDRPQAGAAPPRGRQPHPTAARLSAPMQEQHAPNCTRLPRPRPCAGPPSRPSAPPPTHKAAAPRHATPLRSAPLPVSSSLCRTALAASGGR